MTALVSFISVASPGVRPAVDLPPSSAVVAARDRARSRGPTVSVSSAEFEDAACSKQLEQLRVVEHDRGIVGEPAP